MTDVSHMCGIYSDTSSDIRCDILSDILSSILSVTLFLHFISHSVRALRGPKRYHQLHGWDPGYYTVDPKNGV